jgi:putative membrane protein
VEPRPDQEPDYRFSLANERTFLAWIRTSLALVAAGVGVAQLLPGLGPRTARLVLGVALVALAFIAAVTSYPRWAKTERAMRQGAPLPVSQVPQVLAAGVSAIIALALVLLLVG